MKLPKMKQPLRLLACVLASLGICLAVPAAADAAPCADETQPTTYVLVHGAWGGGWSFKEVDKLLSAGGAKVYRPTLTGLGEKNHLARADINLSTHITDIVNLILWEDLHEVVLVGHSYGGMVITGVVDRVPDRIKRVVYVDAFVPNDGENCIGNRAAQPPFPTVDGLIVPPWVTDPNGKPPHDVPHPAQTFTECLSLKHPEATSKIPVTYILTVDKGRQPEEDQFFRAYERARARGWETVVMEGDHNVQWSHPKELAALLQNSQGRSTQ